MSSLVRNLLCAVAGAAALAGTAGAQLLPPVSLPPVGLPVPTSNVPVAGPVLQNILSQPAAQQAISPTLDSVGGLTAPIAEAGAPTLLELRRLRHQELIRTNRATVETDGSGLPVRRGIVALVEPDPIGLQRVLGAGFRIAADDRNPALGLRIVSLAVPPGMSAKDGLKRLHKLAPELQADFDHLFEPARGSLAPIAGTLARA